MLIVDILYPVSYIRKAFNDDKGAWPWPIQFLWLLLGYLWVQDPYVATHFVWLSVHFLVVELCLVIELSCGLHPHCRLCGCELSWLSSELVDSEDGGLTTDTTSAVCSAVWWFSLPHCVQGKRVKASAFVCFLPCLWTLVNWYSCNFSSHRANLPSGALNDCSQVKDPWSVPKRYGRKCCVKGTTASSSRRVTQYVHSALLRVQLACAITCSFPVSSSWNRPPPIPVLLTSVSKIYGLLKFGKARMSVYHSHWHSVWNASWHSVVHSNLVVFSVRHWRGFAIVAKSWTNLP